MKLISTIVMVLAFYVAGFAQTDKKATEILNGLTAKTKSYKTIKIDFTYAMDNPKQNIHDKFNGSALMKGEKYKLTAAGQDIFSDGKTIWTYLKDAKEVQINSAGEDDGSFSPTKLFTDYNKEFKSKFISEKGNSQVVELYPIKKGKSFTKVRLTVDKAKKQIARFEIFDRNGSTFAYIVNSFVTDQPLNDSLFTFDKKNYPGVEINDMR